MGKREEVGLVGRKGKKRERNLAAKIRRPYSLMRKEKKKREPGAILHRNRENYRKEEKVLRGSKEGRFAPGGGGTYSVEKKE